MPKMQQAKPKRQWNKKKECGTGSVTINGIYYSSMDDYVKEMTQGKQGIYIGNQKIADIQLFNLDNETYEEFINEINTNEITLSLFFAWCYSEQYYNENFGGVPPTLNDALEAAEKLSVNKELVYWAYNNKGDMIRYVQANALKFEEADNDTADIIIPCTYQIRSYKYNFDLDFSLDLQSQVTRERDTETGAIRYEFNEVLTNPESFDLAIENQDTGEPVVLTSDVDLPYGMKLKYEENPYAPEDFEYDYERNKDWIEEDKQTYCEQEADAWNNWPGGKYIIEWQGQTFNYATMRKFINENIIIYNNGKVWDIRSQSTRDLLNVLGVTDATLEKIFEEIMEYYGD